MIQVLQKGVADAVQVMNISNQLATETGSGGYSQVSQ